MDSLLTYWLDTQIHKEIPFSSKRAGRVRTGFGIPYFCGFCTAWDREITGFYISSRYSIGRDRDIDILRDQFGGDRDITICTGSVCAGAGL